MKKKDNLVQSWSTDFKNPCKHWAHGLLSSGFDSPRLHFLINPVNIGEVAYFTGVCGIFLCRLGKQILHKNNDFCEKIGPKLVQNYQKK